MQSPEVTRHQFATVRAVQPSDLVITRKWMARRQPAPRHVAAPIMCGICYLLTCPSPWWSNTSHTWQTASNIVIALRLVPFLQVTGLPARCSASSALSAAAYP
uniref:Uncharacterized protein n=1 Tax=Schistocephalus solidus TaxID=70667 RepID=A0A0V0J350_SCHSO